MIGTAAIAAAPPSVERDGQQVARVGAIGEPPARPRPDGDAGEDDTDDAGERLQRDADVRGEQAAGEDLEHQHAARRDEHQGTCEPSLHRRTVRDGCAEPSAQCAPYALGRVPVRRRVPAQRARRRRRRGLRGVPARGSGRLRRAERRRRRQGRRRLAGRRPQRGVAAGVPRPPPPAGRATASTARARTSTAGAARRSRSRCRRAPSSRTCTRGEVLAELLPPRRPLAGRRRRAGRPGQRQVPLATGAGRRASPSRASTARSAGSSSSCS